MDAPSNVGADGPTSSTTTCLIPYLLQDGQRTRMPALSPATRLRPFPSCASRTSRAPLATRRAAKVADKLRALKGKTTKEKKKPRVSKTSEFAEFERRAGGAQELSEAEGDEDEKLGDAKEQRRHKGAEDEAKERLVR